MPHTAPPKKVTNLEKRTREHLLPNEVEAMIKAAKGTGRHGNRDATLILLAYRHGRSTGIGVGSTTVGAVRFV